MAPMSVETSQYDTAQLDSLVFDVCVDTPPHEPAQSNEFKYCVKSNDKSHDAADHRSERDQRTKDRGTNCRKDRPRYWRLPLSGLKFRLVGFLLKVDPLAAWIVLFSVLAHGVLRSWSWACQARVITTFQESIISRNMDKTYIIHLLCKQIAIQVVLECTKYIGVYGHKRYKGKMKEYVTELFLESWGCLPFNVKNSGDLKQHYAMVHPI